MDGGGRFENNKTPEVKCQCGPSKGRGHSPPFQPLSMHLSPNIFRLSEAAATGSVNYHWPPPPPHRRATMKSVSFTRRCVEDVSRDMASLFHANNAIWGAVCSQYLTKITQSREIKYVEKKNQRSDIVGIVCSWCTRRAMFIVTGGKA